MDHETRTSTHKRPQTDAAAQRTRPSRGPSLADRRSNPASRSRFQDVKTKPSGNALSPSAASTSPKRTDGRIPKTLTATSPESVVMNPPRVAVETHRVQPGDTFLSLAKRYYGDARFASFLIRRNPQIQTRGRLRAGQMVKIPAKPASLRTQTASPSSVSVPQLSKKTSPAKRTYEVRRGDSFYAIARDVLGDASRWKELFQLNRSLVKGDPKKLRVGQVIALPAS